MAKVHRIVVHHLDVKTNAIVIGDEAAFLGTGFRITPNGDLIILDEAGEEDFAYPSGRWLEVRREAQ